MQLFALNYKKNVVFVENANREEAYFCPECSNEVRVRAGKWRRKHFFHPSGSACHQSAKSIEHIQVQYFLQEHLPGSVLLEKRFPELGRIADVVWEQERIIFEVQCSPITAAEVAERNRDYAREGYEVIWIFHEKSFNRKRITAAEHSLLHRPHYFSDIDAEGEGCIYDQHSSLKSGFRIKKSDKAPVSFTLSREPLKGIRKRWGCHLQGTLAVSGMPLKEDRGGVLEWLRKLFYVLLESACR